MHSKTLVLTLPFFKSLIYFPSALYLLGFSLNGVNFYGSIDAFIPVERAVAFIVSLCLFGMFTNNIHKIVTGAKHE